jgi:phage FluMu gp28-like protein
MHIEYTRPPLTPYQTAILDDPARFTVTEASTKTGKTASHIIWLFEQALKCKANQSVWWIAPIFTQSRIAYSRMKAQISQKNFFHTNDSAMLIRLPTGAFIRFKSADKPDSLYGDDVYAAVFDEFTRAKEEAWFALRSTLTATKGRCKLIGNVKGKNNWGYRLGQKAKMREPGYSYHKITAYQAAECGIIAYEEIEQAKKDLPENVFRELYLAEPADDLTNPFGLANIERCIKPIQNGPVVAYGIDLAKYTDWTVIIGLNRQNEVCHIDRFQSDWAMTKAKVIQTIQNTPAYIDSTGVGDPIVEDIQRVCAKAQGIKFTSRSKQQLMEGLTSDIHANDVFFPLDPIGYEMQNFEFEYTRTGVRYTAPSGLHDDCVMALALARDCIKHNRPGLFLYV